MAPAERGVIPTPSARQHGPKAIVPTRPLSPIASSKAFWPVPGTCRPVPLHFCICPNGPQ
jgi:hypothetical protein